MGPSDLGGSNEDCIGSLGLQAWPDSLVSFSFFLSILVYNLGLRTGFLHSPVNGGHYQSSHLLKYCCNWGRNGGEWGEHPFIVI